MKRIIYKTFLFLLPLAIACIPLEILLRKIPNDYSYKRDYLDKNADQIEVLILGSSHSYYDIDPVYFSKRAFNASHVSQTLDWDYALFQKYKDRFTSLETIVLPISYFSLWKKLENDDEHWRIKNYTIYYNMSYHIPYRYRFELFNNKISTLIGQIFNFYILNNYNETCSELGWFEAGELTKAADLDVAGIQAATRHSFKDLYSKKNEAFLHENVRFLSEIIKSNPQVKVILFTPPAYKSYYDNMDEAQLKRMFEQTQQIADNFNNCIYINLLKDERFDVHDFNDADHLNSDGAKKLSLIINEIVMNQ